MDRAYLRFGRMRMCHMIADTLDQLHGMAWMLELKPEWFQGKASFPHYDVCKAKRDEAIKLGAIDCDRRTFVGHMRRIRGAS